ncbi:MAG: hypothetical protein WAX04_04080, partial [Oscillospiraceae bacterium]
EYIWENYPDTEFISEIHIDMIFTNNWEDALVSYLENNDQPMISCGIVDPTGVRHFLDVPAVKLPSNIECFNEYLKTLKVDKVVHGFTNPCIHISKILKQVGGYDAHFLTGKQAFEDDSMLLGYYYYYGTRINWKPYVNYNSIVYHVTAGQRMSLCDNVNINYNGLIKQYGAMGIKHLSEFHKSEWAVGFFSQQYQLLFR